MVGLGQLPGTLTAIEPTIWGQTVRDCMKKLQTLATAGAKDHFRTATAPDGTPWKPLAHPRPNGGDKPLRDKGLLMASISATENATGLTLAASGPGANIHQFGGTIRAKSGKYLAIPLTKEAKRIGSPRKNGFPRALFSMECNGKLFLAEAKEKGPKKNRVTHLTLHYALKSSVVIPARPFIGFSQATLDKMQTVLWETYYQNLNDAIARAQAQYANDNLIFGRSV